MNKFRGFIFKKQNIFLKIVTEFLILLFGWFYLVFFISPTLDLYYRLIYFFIAHFVLRVFTFTMFRIYASNWRYLQFNQFIQYTVIILIESLIITYLVFPTEKLFSNLIRIFFIFLSLTTIARIIIFFFLNPEGRKKKQGEIPLLIYGAGTVTMHLLQDLMDSDLTGKYKIAAIVDNDKNKISNRIGPYRIYSGEQVHDLIEKLSIREVWFTMPFARDFIQSVIDSLTGFSLSYKIVPRKSEQLIPDIRSIRIEDLVKRPEIHLKSNHLNDLFQNKRIIITGAAGSIGSEIARQIITFKPQRVVFVDQYEKGIYDLEKEFSKDQYAIDHAIAYIADIQNARRMKEIIFSEKPHMVFHAAAYKHVPLMEINFTEAIDTNIIGTYRLFDIIREFSQISKHPIHLVNISSDKAVSPENIMGITKRISELLAYNIAHKSNGKLKSSSVRFGNVLGSSGSVVPLFWEQIQNHENITITHPDMERFFMTIPEAVHLVFHATLQSTGEDIMALDMGKPVKITDLAERLIMLAGLVPGKDIQIEYIGKRPGEKMKEELFWTKSSVKTENPYIFRSTEDLKELDVKSFISKTLEALNSKPSLSWWKKYFANYISIKTN